ncbi:MAG: hypothetical protein EP338_09905 [Bacteroidetes bacterium]|nr:MAG: hypothetical protein EP338_09905 [Bacteroidota bacterium]
MKQHILNSFFFISLGFQVISQVSCKEIAADYSGVCIQHGSGKEVVLYEHGRRIGILEKYDREDQLRLKRSKDMLLSKSLMGELNGASYNQEGTIQEEINIVNGTGSIKLFHEDTIELVASFIDGHPSGVWSYFFPFGPEEKRLQFDSSLVTSYRDFEELYDAFKDYEDLLKGIHYETSSFTGLFLEYYQPGKLLRTMNFKDGKLVDTLKTYSYQGHLSEEASVSAKVHNECTGFAKWYDPSGTIYAYFDFNQGTGVYWEYYEEEQVSYTGYYDQGKANGTWVVKDADGTILCKIKSSILNPVQCQTMSCIMDDFANKRRKMRKIYNPNYVNPWETPPPRKN